MRMLIALLPLLGLVAAQYNARGNVNDGFFNDLGQSTSTLPPWANPAGNVGGVGGVAQHPNPIGGSYGGSQSSTKPPAGGVAPIGNPQLPAMPGANADPSKSGGSSGGMTGFGAIDYFNGGGGPDVLSPQAAPAPAGGSNTNQNSGEQKNGFFGGGADGGGGYDMGPGLIAGGGFDSKDMQEKSNANEVVHAGAAAGTVVGVVIAVLIVIGIFALVAVFLVRQRRQSRVVIGSV